MPGTPSFCKGNASIRTPWLSSCCVSCVPVKVNLYGPRRTSMTDRLKQLVCDTPCVDVYMVCAANIDDAIRLPVEVPGVHAVQKPAGDSIPPCCLAIDQL